MRFKLLLSLMLLAAGAVGAQPITAIAVGHEFRQDDLPSVAACPDGSAWIAWLSFGGDRDDLAVRQFKDNKWGALQWVPGSSSDNWLPQIACDARSRISALWSQPA